jgi:hypothetical protein
VLAYSKSSRISAARFFLVAFFCQLGVPDAYRTPLLAVDELKVVLDAVKEDAIEAAGRTADRPSPTALAERASIFRDTELCVVEIFM